MRHEAEAFVETLRAAVGVLHFQADRSDPHRGADSFDRQQNLFPYPTTTKLPGDIDLIDQREAPGELQAEAEREDHIPRRLPVEIDKIGMAELWITEEGFQGMPVACFVEGNVIARVKVPHQGEEPGDVRRRGWPEGWIHGISIQNANNNEGAGNSGALVIQSNPATRYFTSTILRVVISPPDSRL